MPKTFSKYLIFLSILLTPFLVAYSKENVRLARYADIHKDKVTFVYAGDIYVADRFSGDATRLTSHQGFEVFPKFSHDGQKIAFSAEYTGTRQLYMMNLDGSGLKQLTWYNDVGPMPPRGGYDYRVLDWSHDNSKVLVRANRLPWGVRMGRPYWVSIEGDLAEPLAIPETGGGMLSPDGTKYIYTPIDREFRTWKRYRGGRAQDVWIYDLEKDSSEQLTTHNATDYHPTWVGDDIYFLSDRDYTINLYKYQKGSSPIKVTNHSSHDSLWASAGPEAIIYENDGYLWRFDPATQASEQIKINIQGNPSDLIATSKNVAGNIESMSISNDAQRVAIGARGEIFTVPAENGEIRNISNTPSSREISVSWSPNNQYIAYLSDASGEYEIYFRDTKNSNKEKQLTKNGEVWRFDPIWSPDSEKLAYSDINHILWVVDLKTGKSMKLDQSTRNDIQDYSWSHNSEWLTYTKTEDNGFNSIWVAKANGSTKHQLTTKSTNDSNPVFSNDGQHLFFLSNRDYNLAFSSYEFNYLYNNATRIYAASLTNSIKPLYKYKSDEVTLITNDDSESKEDPKESKDKDEGLKITPKGFENRVFALSAASGNYGNLQVNDSSLFVIKNDRTTELQMLSLTEDKKPATVAKGVNNYIVAGNGLKILAQSGTNFSIIDAAASQNLSAKQLDFENLTLKIDPKTEWQQMYVDGWRILRDWFYDSNIHGMDWQAVKAKYQPWVNEATHRTDLDYAFGEIAGELNAGHIYVNAGDQPSVQRKQNGLLGAEFKKHRSGYFEVAKVYAGENWTAVRRSPLTEPGVNVKQGDYILAINGHDTSKVNNIYQLLEHQTDRHIELTINDKASFKGSRIVHVEPITSEVQLRYLEWVSQRMKMVEELSGGRIGYVHLPNTAQDGNRELHKQLLPQITKDALIIDDRYNGGGFIPDRMIEILSRKTLNYWKRRGQKPNATPLIAHDGPKAMLINGQSSSGGDALPYYFRKVGLGKIIGTRTWGGLIGISGNPGLADGGLLLASTFRFLDTEGNWAVENEGVSPDIEVIDRPELVAKGRDPSLERAIQELLKELAENPRKLMKAPPAPTNF